MSKLTTILLLSSIFVGVQIPFLLYFHKKKSLGEWWTFMKWGMLFAAVHELLNMVIIQGNWSNYFYTLPIFYPFFITLSYAVSRWNKPVALLLFAAIGGRIVELAMGQGWAPQLLVALLSNIGVMTYWVTVGYFPQLVIEGTHKNLILKSFLGVTLFTYVAGFILGAGSYAIALFTYIVWVVWICLKCRH